MADRLLDHPPDPGEMEGPAAPASATGANTKYEPLSYTNADAGRQARDLNLEARA